MTPGVESAKPRDFLNGYGIVSREMTFMNWFEQMCRNAGLTVHNMRHPQDPTTQTQEVRRTIEEQKVSPTVTLRRTTVEEVEVQRQGPAAPPDAASRPRS